MCKGGANCVYVPCKCTCKVLPMSAFHTALGCACPCVLVSRVWCRWTENSQTRRIPSIKSFPLSGTCALHPSAPAIPKPRTPLGGYRPAMFGSRVSVGMSCSLLRVLYELNVVQRFVRALHVKTERKVNHFLHYRNHLVQ